MKLLEDLKKAVAGMNLAGSNALVKPELVKPYDHLRSLHKAFMAKPPKVAWQQPVMTTKQQRDYNSVRAALINPNTPVETLNTITAQHPMFNHLTASDHANAYKHWYRQYQNMPENDPGKKMAQENYENHLAQIEHKR